ncbi:MAG TPA: hypothetical protein VMN79_16115 [Casimicrobiaceae bacterium]|nr:hypothetical protein [Casimicrobiaceae bacterium]
MSAAPLRIGRGIAGALRAQAKLFAWVAAGLFVLEIFLPPAILSIVRKPIDYFGFNPWVAELPRYLLRDDVRIQQKLDFIPNLALFWFSADSPFGGVDWGFAVTVADLFRFLVMALLFGVYFALVRHNRDVAQPRGRLAAFGSGGGASGALASVLGVSTGGCTVMGCGLPVMPVVGLAFAGLSSGALALLAEISNVATTAIIAVMAIAVLYLGWRAGGREPTSA